MSRRPVVVDGSNLATEGRSMPSLAQLDEAVRAWLSENPDDEVIVVVDASFSYRIDESERKTFEEAEDAGEVVSPPAGAVGRGDGFLLRIADRVDAAVLSNDSFQEFHGEYKWLFDSGRLLGGKPVPGVGWIFTPRTPVRGPKSRMAVRDAQRATKGPRSEPVVKAIAQATAEAIEVPERSLARRQPRRREGRGAESAPVTSHEAVNDPLPFVTFIAEHPLGTEVEGRVVSFTSHGAFVEADGARCYVPVVGLGDPPPRTAKAVLKSREVRTFVVQALDPPRRGIELALPEVAKVAGAPTDETVEAEIGAGDARRAAPRRAAAGIPPPPRGSRSPAAGVLGPSGLPSGGRARIRPPAAVEPTEPVAAVEAKAEPQVRGPRRSLRRSGGSRTGEEAVAAATASPEPVTPRRSRRAAASEPVTPGPDAAEATPRRRSRKAAASVAATTEQTAEPTAAAPTVDEAAAAAPAPRARTRRPAKKAAPVTDTPLSPIDTGALLDETIEKGPARASRTRKPAARSSPDDATPAAVIPPARRRVATRAAPEAEVEGPPVASPRRASANKAASRPESPETPPEPARKVPAKKVTAKKAPARKAPARKVSAAKKAPGDAPAKRDRSRPT